MEWLQQLLQGMGMGGGTPAGGGTALLAGGGIPGLDLPLDQVAQAKLAGGSPYEQDAIAAALGGGMGPTKDWRSKMGGIGEKMVLQGLSGPGGLGQAPLPSPGRGPMPQGRQPGPGPIPAPAFPGAGAGGVGGLGGGFTPSDPSAQQRQEEERRKQGRFLFAPSLY